MATHKTINQDLSNFTALKHFFPCTEASTDVMSDIVGGVTITHAADLTRTADGHGVGNPSIGANTALTSGTWTDTTTKNLILFWVGNGNTLGTVNIGGSGAGEQYISASHASIVAAATLDDGTTNVQSTGAKITSDSVYGAATVAEIGSATGLVKWEVDATSGAVVISGSDPDISGISTVTLTAKLSMANNTNLYGLALFAFTTLPSDIEEALEWMYNHWVIGDKRIYPGWSGLS